MSIGRTEAMALHEQAIARISEEIASGTYAPDLNVVAERVAEVLGAV